MLHTENMGRGGKLSFQNVGGSEGVYDVLPLQKFRGGGGKSSPRGGKGPLASSKCSPALSFPLSPSPLSPSPSAVPPLHLSHQCRLSTASPKPGVSTTVSRSFTPFSSISTVVASILTVCSIRSEGEREGRKGRRETSLFAHIDSLSQDTISLHT